jgi:CRISPR-associated protein Csd1
MNWLESLARTFEANSQSVGSTADPLPLAPVAHTVQTTHVVITLDANGELLGAKADALITIIPCTDESAGRTAAPVPHPLSDKLQYVAADFYELTGETMSSKAKENPAKNHHAMYLEALGDWESSQHGDPKITAVKNYMTKNCGRLLNDLCEVGIYPTAEDGKILKKWNGDKDTKPDIYELTKNSPNPWNAFVRWDVNIPGDLENRTYQDPKLWKKWRAYYLERPRPKGLCYVSGQKSAILATNHPKRIRSLADGAKLISANDSSGFTFRGRFTDKNGLQTCGVSFDTTQKAHNALRWLIARQGKRFGDQAVVAWAVGGQEIPDALASTHDLLAEEEFLDAGFDSDESPLLAPDTGQTVGLTLKRKLSGYRADLGDVAEIVILALDSATPGRLAISYYRELKSSEYLKRVESWHSETAWLQNFGKTRHFIGAPAPLDIAQTAFGTRLDEKLKAATYLRLLPCIIENRPIPRDLVSSCIQRATNRLSHEHWEWEKALGIACALYRKQQIQTNQHHYTMSLERDRSTRSYLYGRLLAVADVLEQTALRSAGENRDTNAARFMQRFASQPYATWTNIYLSLEPYRRRLKANEPGLLHKYEEEIDEIKNLFDSVDYQNDQKLEGEFLLAYHCQRTALYTKKEDEQPLLS